MTKVTDGGGGGGGGEHDEEEEEEEVNEGGERKRKHATKNVETQDHSSSMTYSCTNR